MGTIVSQTPALNTCNQKHAHAFRRNHIYQKTDYKTLCLRIINNDIRVVILRAHEAFALKYGTFDIGRYHEPRLKTVADNPRVLSIYARHKQVQPFKSVRWSIWFWDCHVLQIRAHFPRWRQDGLNFPPTIIK